MIVAEDISKSYNGEYCLRGVSLHVHRGEFVSVMGKSGSGKTSLVEILAGVRTADGGKVRVCGEDVFSLSPSALARFRRTKLGAVYQSFGLISTLTAADNILLPLTMERVPRGQSVKKLNSLAERLGISRCLCKYPDDLSGGQRQRIAIARALIYSPEVLLLDEPTGSLDEMNTKNVLNLIREINRATGITVLQITHSRSAAEYGDRILTLEDGKIVQ